MTLKNYRKINNKMIQCCYSCLHGIHLHDKEIGCTHQPCDCRLKFPYVESYKKYVREELYKTSVISGQSDKEKRLS